MKRFTYERATSPEAALTAFKDDRATAFLAGGTTLIELTIALALVSVLASISLTRAGQFLDAIAVRGAITEIQNPYLNLQSLKTDGLDIELSYAQPGQPADVQLGGPEAGGRARDPLLAELPTS